MNAMVPIWIPILALLKMYLTQPVHLYQMATSATVEFGHTATLRCTLEEKDTKSLIVWYKQTIEHLLQAIGITGPAMDTIIFPPFKNSSIKLDRIKNNVSLTISHATKEDEGMYYCGSSQVNVIRFFRGTFLALRGQPHFKNKVSVVQSPDVGRVPPGESVSLQCSVLSERRTAELQVFWFRSSAGDSHPEIISTHHNSSRQCVISSSPHSCVYNLSKSVLSVSDTGTYYCAVLTCGKILLGNGTTVGLTSRVDAVLMMVGAALGVCVLVISAQAVLICRRRNCEHCSVRLQQGAMETKITSQDHDTVELNYAAFQFSKRKPRRGQEKRGQEKRGQEKRGQLEHSIYSEVLYSTATD
ncbi:uncharacterized protein LOC143527581 isoform X2 [Brachyhypopomus gauderio]|uniref:uncharacterized protein LOC143527581 isoform X2 n=1 Tax=Brachyhypopomus gauderio TaxID=698409 RepID=UPI004042AFE8